MAFLPLAQRHGAVAFAFFVLAVGMTWWHRHFGFIDFGGMDGGVLIQAAWTVANGGIPYTDIPDPLPPLFFLGAGLAFKLGGASWSSLNWLVCVFALVTFAWSFVLLVRVARTLWRALFFAVIFQGVTLLPISWWWYNQITALSALLALLSGYGLARFPRDRVWSVSLGCSAALLFLCKINTAAPVMAFLAVVLLTRRLTRGPACLALAAGAAADGILFLALNISPLAYLRLVREFSVRVSSGEWIRYCLVDALPTEHLLGFQVFGVLAVACGVLTWFQDDPARRRDLALWFLTAIAVGFIQMATNNDFKTGDTLYLFLVAALALPGVRRLAPLGLGGGMAILCSLFLLGLGLMFGANRERVLSMGTTFYADGTPPTRLIERPALLRGLGTGDKLVRVLDQIDTVVRSQAGVRPPPAIFFGPRIDFSYAAYGLPYPKGLPIWWEKVPSSHRGEQYPMGEHLPDFIGGPARWLPDDAPLDPRVQRFIDAGFTLCIFVRGFNHIAEMIYFPPNLRAYIFEHYRRVDYPDIVVFTRK